MTKINLYNQQGNKTEKFDLNEDIFDTEINESVVHEVFTILRANQREPWAHTKNRAEKSGGGKKPWRQKGTGRARHGSIRSPLWKNGGITFGARNEENLTKKINKKKKREAVKMCLADKVNEELLFVLENLETSGKTKEMAKIKDSLLDEDRPTLLLLDQQDENTKLASRNIPDFDCKLAKDVNVMDFLNNKYIITTKEGVNKLQQRFS
jgi:large subunit ribosomal protein L4